jgi:hypothetical protein
MCLAPTDENLHSLDANMFNLEICIVYYEKIKGIMILLLSSKLSIEYTTTECMIMS